MKKLRRIADAVAVAALLTALCAFAFAEPKEGKPPPVKQRRYVVAAMGDSLTDPRSFGGKYLDVLRRRCPGSRFDSYGVGGQMVNQMRRRFARDVLGQPPDEDNPKPSYTHVIVLGGLNDILSDESASRTNDKIVKDLQAMFKLAQDGGLEVVAVTLPPWAGFERYHNRRRQASTLLINRWLRRQAGKGGRVDRVLDAYPLLSCGQPAFLCQPYALKDQVHWSKQGHEVIGQALHRQIFSDCR